MNASREKRGGTEYINQIKVDRIGEGQQEWIILRRAERINKSILDQSVNRNQIGADWSKQ